MTSVAERSEFIRLSKSQMTLVTSPTGKVNVEMLTRLNPTRDSVLLESIISEMKDGKGFIDQTNLMMLRKFAGKMKVALAPRDVKKDALGGERVANSAGPKLESVSNLHVFGPRSLEKCCVAAVREPVANALEYEFNGNCTHFLRQCRRRASTESSLCEDPVQSEYKFCRQHMCFQPKFVYTASGTYPKPMNGSQLVDIWGGSSLDAGPIGDTTGNFLQHIDSIFKFSRADIVSLDKKNKHQLDRFKQNVIENVKSNIDLLVQNARDIANASQIYCDPDSENELCEVDPKVEEEE